ncbi:MAG: hypothetical protein JSV62_00980 [Promethearchaeota archaeon]|nr:MAG: hypothetical protein JSV62_00980 [Candidatus Lokiarchaeota archaeon]
MIEQQVKTREKEISIEKNICSKCVNDISVSGISFNSNNICNYCEEYERLESRLTDYNALIKLWLGRIEKYKGQGDYDALVGLSGGKDSTYVLYQLKNTYGLKVKAWTLDQGFLTKWSKERIESIVSELGVDHEYSKVDQTKITPLYILSIMATGGPCYTCSYVMYGLFIKTASEQNIPMAVHGRSRPQMLKIYSPHNKFDPYKPFLEMSLKPIEDVNLTETYEDVLAVLNTLLPANEVEKFSVYFPDLQCGNIAEFVPYFLYHPYDETRLVEFLEANMNWKRHQDYAIFTHFDCAAHDAAGYLYEIADERPFIMPELSVSIREGIISREDALKRLEKETFTEFPTKSMETLTKYINKTQRSLISNARRIARRRSYTQ